MTAEHPKIFKSRFGGYSTAYAEISESEFSKSVNIENQWKKESDDLICAELEDQHFEAGVKTILFSALSVEAAINDYAAWQLGDNYFSSHLASLDVVSKWVVIPKLVCSKALDKGGPAYAALKRLIRARNDLVHNKSHHYSARNPKIDEVFEKRSKEFDENIANAYRAIVLLSLTMDKIIGPQYNPLKTFDKNINVFLSIPENIVDIVNECRNIIGNNYS